jgi:signal transduction histidine kinase
MVVGPPYAPSPAGGGAYGGMGERPVLALVRTRVRARVRSAAVDTWYGLLAAAGAFASIALVLLDGYFTALIVIGIGAAVLPFTTGAVRWLANHNRRWAARYGVAIPVPYQPEPPTFERDVVGWTRRCQWILTDPATWRDLAWLLVNSVAGMIGFVPLAALYYAGEGLALALGLWRPVMDATGAPRWYLFVPVGGPWTAVAAAVLALLVLAAWTWVAPGVMVTYAHINKILLAPTERAELASRVRQLAATRTESLDVQAAELRRIERDLHDGAQARLVGLGLTLGAVERTLDRDPDEARRLLQGARESSVAALRELRDLVRGIHPPVLAERGLCDAVRALCLASPLDVTIRAQLPGNPEPPVESAVYFAVSELLTNTLKHADATQVEVDLGHEHGLLRVCVRDDGRGGADPAQGSGLAGVRRRLASFDGTMDVRSPAGGHTVITLELPCVLSSPKTSTS